MQVALIAASVTPTAPVLALIWLVVVVVVVASMLLVLQPTPTCANGFNKVTCAAGVFPSINWCNVSTCICDGHYSLQLVLVVCMYTYIENLIVAKLAFTSKKTP